MQSCHAVDTNLNYDNFKLSRAMLMLIHFIFHFLILFFHCHVFVSVCNTNCAVCAVHICSFSYSVFYVKLSEATWTEKHAQTYTNESIWLNLIRTNENIPFEIWLTYYLFFEKVIGSIQSGNSFLTKLNEQFSRNILILLLSFNFSMSKYVFRCLI